MLQFEAPIFVEDKFDDNGKWMDGWETRRKRHAGYDWCIVKLGVAGTIQAVDIDTTFYRQLSGICLIRGLLCTKWRHCTRKVATTFGQFDFRAKPASCF